MRNLFLTILAATALMLGGCASTAGGDITLGTWHLTSITSIQRQAIVPPEGMANYTITFNDDGTFDAKADCNQLSGTYTVVDESVLTLTREERLEPLAVKVVPPQPTEFICSNCYLVKHRSQLKDKAKMLCRDCA